MGSSFLLNLRIVAFYNEANLPSPIPFRREPFMTDSNKEFKLELNPGVVTPRENKIIEPPVLPLSTVQSQNEQIAPWINSHPKNGKNNTDKQVPIQTTSQANSTPRGPQSQPGSNSVTRPYSPQEGMLNQPKYPSALGNPQQMQVTTVDPLHAAPISHNPAPDVYSYLKRNITFQKPPVEFTVKNSIIGTQVLKNGGAQSHPQLGAALWDKFSTLQRILSKNFPAYKLDGFSILDVDDMLNILDSELTSALQNKQNLENKLKAVNQENKSFTARIEKLEDAISSAIEKQEQAQLNSPVYLPQQLQPKVHRPNLNRHRMPYKDEDDQFSDNEITDYEGPKSPYELRRNLSSITGFKNRGPYDDNTPLTNRYLPKQIKQNLGEGRPSNSRSRSGRRVGHLPRGHSSDNYYPDDIDSPEVDTHFIYETLDGRHQLTPNIAAMNSNQPMCNCDHQHPSPSCQVCGPRDYNDNSNHQTHERLRDLIGYNKRMEPERNRPTRSARKEDISSLESMAGISNNSISRTALELRQQNINKFLPVGQKLLSREGPGSQQRLHPSSQSTASQRGIGGNSSDRIDAIRSLAGSRYFGKKRP